MTDNGGMHNLKTSTRLALAATSAIDPNARVIKRWSVGGTSALDRLMKMEKRLQAIEGEREGYALPGSESAAAAAAAALEASGGANEDKESVRSKDSRPSSVLGGSRRRPTVPSPPTGARKSLAEHAGSKGQAIFSTLHAAKKVAEPVEEEEVRERISFRDDVQVARENKLSHMTGGGRRRTGHRDSTPIIHEEMQF
jgi:hypothetical protein